MFVEGKLSLSQKADGQRRYLLFSIFNGLSFACLGETFLILFALKMNCPAYIVAGLTSFLFMGNLFMIFGKSIVSRVGAVRTITYTWIARNIFAALMALAPFVAVYSKFLGLSILITGSFLFYASRSTGLIASQPILADIAPGNVSGKFSSQCFRFYFGANLFCLGILVVLLRFFDSLSFFQIVITVGSLFGFVASYAISKTRETHAPMKSAAQPIKEALKKTWVLPKYRRMLLAHCFAISGVMLMLPVSMLALKKGYMVDDSTAMLFGLVQLAGCFCVSYLNSILADEAGPRPLAILYFSGLILVAFLWLVAPASFEWYYIAVLFFIGGVCQSGIFMTLLHYSLLSIEDEDRVGVTLFVSVASGGCGGVTGIVLVSTLIAWLQGAGYETLALYKTYFVVAIVLMFFCLIFLFRLEPLEEWRITQILGLAFAPRDMRTLLHLYRMDALSSFSKERDSIDRLLEMHSQLSEKQVLEYMKSPTFWIRSKAMYVLAAIPLSDKGIDALLYELKNCEYSTAFIAASILGEKRIKKAVPYLMRTLESEDIYLQGKSMLSLAQLEEEGAYERIREIFSTSTNPRIIIHGASALAIIGGDKSFKLLLNKAIEKDIHPQARDEVLCAIVTLTKQGNELYNFLKLFPKEPDDAVSLVCENIQNPENMEYTAKLSELLTAFHAGKVQARNVIDHILTASPMPEDSVLAAFLRKVDHEKLCPEFVFAISAVSASSSKQ